MSTLVTLSNEAQTLSAAEIMDRINETGDIGALSADERNQYYAAVCSSVGLNPITRPFEFITLDGKLQLYARKDCAEQLRKINGISCKIVSKEIIDGIYTVHVQATDKAAQSRWFILSVFMTSVLALGTSTQRPTSRFPGSIAPTS